MTGFVSLQWYVNTPSRDAPINKIQLAGVAQSAAILVAVHNGMGKNENLLDSQQLTVILKVCSQASMIKAIYR